MILGLVPIVCFFIIFAKFIVLLLYSNEFIVAVDYVRIMAISLLLRVVWQTCSTTFMASGHNKLYLWFDAIVGNGVFLVLTLIAFYFWGLRGLSFSFIVSSLFVLILLIIAVRRVTNAYINNGVLALLSVSMILLSVLYICVTYLNGVLRTVITCFLALCIMAISLYLLNKRVNILEIMKSLIHRVHG